MRNYILGPEVQTFMLSSLTRVIVSRLFTIYYIKNATKNAEVVLLSVFNF